jgi:hypothetical protein
MTVQFFQSGAARANDGETKTAKIRSATAFFIFSIVRDRKGTLMRLIYRPILFGSVAEVMPEVNYDRCGRPER